MTTARRIEDDQARACSNVRSANGAGPPSVWQPAQRLRNTSATASKSTAAAGWTSAVRPNQRAAEPGPAFRGRSRRPPDS